MTDLVILSGNPRIGSRTSAFAGALADALGPGFGEPRRIELADAVAVGFGATAVAPNVPQPDAVEAVAAARVLIVATPSYKGTYTGLLKVFLDQLPPVALMGVVAVPVAVAGSETHREATVADLHRVLFELGATVPVRVGVREDELANLPMVVARHARRINAYLAEARV